MQETTNNTPVEETTKDTQQRISFFESKIKPLLTYIGTIIAIVMAIAYVIVVFVLIKGFKAETILNTSIFSFVTAVIGFCIMQMLKVQGKSFAESIEENKVVLKKFTRLKTKERKLHTMKYFWVTSGLSDVLSRCLTLGIMSVGMVYIMIEGSNDYSLLLLAMVNLLMFAGFGLLSMVAAYDFYNNEYVPYMLEKIKENETQNQSKETIENVIHVESREQSDSNIEELGRTSSEE